MTADDTLRADERDRHAALSIAAENARVAGTILGPHIRKTADEYYRWLRERDTLRATSIGLLPQEAPLDTSYSGPDTDPVTFTVGGVDGKNSATAAPADTWNYSLNDPDNSGAALAVAGDLLSATVTPGAASANVSLTVTGQNTGMVATCAIAFTAGSAVGVELVPAVPPAA